MLINDGLIANDEWWWIGAGKLMLINHDVMIRWCLTIKDGPCWFGQSCLILVSLGPASCSRATCVEMKRSRCAELCKTVRLVSTRGEPVPLPKGQNQVGQNDWKITCGEHFGKFDGPFHPLRWMPRHWQPVMLSCAHSLMKLLNGWQRKRSAPLWECFIIQFDKERTII